MRRVSRDMQPDDSVRGGIRDQCPRRGYRVATFGCLVRVVAHTGEGFDAYAAPVVSIPIPASRARTIASARVVAPIFQKMFVT